MTFQQLLYLVEIAKNGSINKAAQSLFVSQSSISCAIKDLEDELGICFFERHNRGVDFTEEGKEFLNYAQLLLAQKQHVESMYKKKSAAPPAHFSVSTQRYPFTEDAFIRLLKRVNQESFAFSLKESSMDTVINDVYENYADIGVIFLSDRTEKILERILEVKGIRFEELRKVPPCVFVRREHPLAGKASVTSEDLSSYPYLTFEQSQSAALDFSEEVQLLSFQRPAHCVKVNSRAAAVNIIAGTDAVTTGSGLLVSGLMDTRMISIPLAGSDFLRLGWIHSSGRRPSPRVLEFVELLQQSISESVTYTERIRGQFLREDPQSQQPLCPGAIIERSE